MATVAQQSIMADPRIREANVTVPVYKQLPFVPERASGCDIFTKDGRRILPPLVLEPGHIDHLARALRDIAPATD